MPGFLLALSVLVISACSGPARIGGSVALLNESERSATPTAKETLDPPRFPSSPNVVSITFKSDVPDDVLREHFVSRGVSSKAILDYEVGQFHRLAPELGHLTLVYFKVPFAGFEGDFDVMSTYLNAHSVLFLSDGSTFGLADSLSEAYPEKTVIKSDYDLQGCTVSKTNSHFFSVHVDNKQPLPMQSGFYDRIVMRRGMCVCPAPGATQVPQSTCGGISASESEAHSFFSEVARVLKPVEGARATLDAGHSRFVKERGFLSAWTAAGRQLMKERPDIEFAYVFYPQSGSFAVELTPRKSVPNAPRLPIASSASSAPSASSASSVAAP